MRILLMLLLIAGATAADGATLVGSVADAETAEPLAGAVVFLADWERGTITGSDGRYALSDVPPGPQHLHVRLIGYAPRALHALVPRSGELEINVSLHRRPVRVRALDVRGPVAVRGLDSGDSAAVSDRESSIAAVRNHPLLTEPDVLQAIGGGDVVLSAETPTGIHVKGGAADQLAYRIDGIPIFSPYHAAGMASAWNPDALSRLSLGPEGASAGHPHSLDGTLDAATLAPGDRLRAQGSVSTTQARVTIDGPLGAAGARFLLSGRSGFAGLLSHKSESSHLRGETGDWLAKVEVPAFHGRLRLLGYDSKNEIDAAASPGSAPDSVPADPDNAFDWRSRSWGAEWRLARGSATLRVLGWSARGDAAAAWSAEAGPVTLAAERHDVGALADVEVRMSRTRLHAGIRAERAKTSYRIDSDSVADVALRARTPVASAFATVARNVTTRVTLGLGSAVTAFEDRAYASPRATLRWSPSERLSLSGRFDQRRQFAQSLRNPESVVGTIFPFDLYLGADSELGGGPGGPDGPDGTRGVPVARSEQGVVTADLRPGAGIRLTLQAYARGSDRLVLVAPRSGEPFSLGAHAMGSGTSRGIALEVAMNGTRYGFLASYGHQRVRLAYGDSSYVPEHGAEHLLQGGIILFPSSTLSVRIGADAAWGRRTTMASGDFEWEACNLLDLGCEFGGSPHYWGEALGGVKLPAYYRVDLGVRQHWHFTAGGRDVSVALFAAATNLLGRKNVLTYARNPTTGETTAIEMRPRAPFVVGLEWRF